MDGGESVTSERRAAGACACCGLSSCSGNSTTIYSCCRIIVNDAIESSYYPCQITTARSKLHNVALSSPTQSRKQATSRSNLRKKWHLPNPRAAVPQKAVQAKAVLPRAVPPKAKAHPPNHHPHPKSRSQPVRSQRLCSKNQKLQSTAHRRRREECTRRRSWESQPSTASSLPVSRSRMA